MALSCNGNGEITLQEIVNAINQNEISIDDLKLDDLLDVNAPSPSDGSVIVFDAANNEWIVSSPPNTQIQSDWNQSDNTKVDFIKNKPNVDDYEKDLGTPEGNDYVLVSDINDNRSWKEATAAFGVDLGYNSTDTTVTITNTSGNDATIPAATNAVAGVMSASDKSSIEWLLMYVDGGTY